MMPELLSYIDDTRRRLSEAVAIPPPRAIPAERAPDERISSLLLQGAFAGRRIFGASMSILSCVFLQFGAVPSLHSLAHPHLPLLPTRPLPNARSCPSYDLRVSHLHVRPFKFLPRPTVVPASLAPPSGARLSHLLPCPPSLLHVPTVPSCPNFPSPYSLFPFLLPPRLPPNTPRPCPRHSQPLPTPARRRLLLRAHVPHVCAAVSPRRLRRRICMPAPSSAESRAPVESIRYRGQWRCRACSLVLWCVVVGRTAARTRAAVAGMRTASSRRMPRAHQTPGRAAMSCASAPWRKRPHAGGHIHVALTDAAAQVCLCVLVVSASTGRRRRRGSAQRFDAPSRAVRCSCRRVQMSRSLRARAELVLYPGMGTDGPAESRLRVRPCGGADVPSRCRCAQLAMGELCVLRQYGPLCKLSSAPGHASPARAASRCLGSILSLVCAVEASAEIWIWAG
ncbi:hypothetical protein FB451DRAFT_1395708 [Mycena latifolia]|nr:hypothetical protein FB451DRAFT_1395708 [Mycena latifolia]